VITQGFYQAELICGARPVEKVVLDPKLSKHDRDQLLLIAALKRFSVSQMGMLASNNYSTINPKWDHSLYVVSACKELSFEAHQWKFPFIGRVPYLGHFSEKDAISAENKLKAQGLDTMLRSVAAYSSLGYFNDPIWPQMLRRSIHSLAELILHELAHSTLYFNGRADFNESLANFVGRVGALEFIERNYGANSFEYEEAIRYNSDDESYSSWMNAVYDRLDSIYTTSQADDEKRKLKTLEITHAKGSFQDLGFRSQAFRKSQIPELNNAVLIMSRRYNTNQDDFEKVFLSVNRNWPEFYRKLETLQGNADPFLALKKLVE
jgi:predicted aminopeptidase